MPVQSQAKLDELLQDLRDNPIDARDARQERILAEVLDYLRGLPKASDSACHWFCERAEATTREAAAFLTRLFAFDGRQANDWKERLAGCISNCALCAKTLQAVKCTSRRT
jgi:senataxin